MSTLSRDFLRLLREDSEFRDEVRRELLSKELIELPEKFAAFVQETRQEFSEVKTRLGNLEDSVSRLDGTVNRLDGTVGRLDGREYERQVSRTLTGEVSRVLGIRRGRLVYSAAYGINQQFQEQMEDAADAERMTDSQWHELLRLDAIIKAVENSRTVFAVAEISTTVHEEDITRAEQRAAILEQATGLKTYPVVIGDQIPQPQIDQASAKNITVIRVHQEGR